MQIVKIKNSKYLWKKIVIILVMLFIIYTIKVCFTHLRFRYEYYIVEKDGYSYTIGYSSNNNIIEETLDEYLKNKDVIDFYFKKYIGKKRTFMWTNHTKTNNDIKKIIIQNIGIKTE